MKLSNVTIKVAFGVEVEFEFFPTAKIAFGMGDKIINTQSKSTLEATSLIINLQKYSHIYITH